MNKYIQIDIETLWSYTHVYQGVLRNKTFVPGYKLQEYFYHKIIDGELY